MTLLLYCSLLFLVFHLTPEDNFSTLYPEERLCAAFAASIQFSVFTYKGIRIALEPKSEKWAGVTAVNCVVWTVALTTNTIFALGYELPILIDPITHCRVHMVRWCEWSTLAFTMTFMSDIIDGHDGKPKIVDSILVGVSQSLSTICGLLFPIMPGVYSWSLLMTISCVLFVVLYFRINLKIRRVRRLRERQRESLLVVTTPDMEEELEVASCAFNLLLTCTCFWTLFLINYGFSWAWTIQYIAPVVETRSEVGRLLSLQSLILKAAAKFSLDDLSSSCRSGLSCGNFRYDYVPFVVDCVVDITCKFFYGAILFEMYGRIFDPAKILERQLERTKKELHLFWRHSHDVLIVSRLREFENDEGTYRCSITASPSMYTLAKITEDFASPNGIQSNTLKYDFIFRVETSDEDSGCAPKVAAHDASTISPIRSSTRAFPKTSFPNDPYGLKRLV